MRQIASMAALRAAKMKGPLGDSYRAMVARGVVKLKAVVALMLAAAAGELECGGTPTGVRRGEVESSTATGTGSVSQ